MWKQITVTAPGRICLFGEHQDFLGLSVIACAIDLGITIQAHPRPGGLMRVHLPDVGTVDEFAACDGRPPRHERDYLPSVVRVLRREGHELPGLEAMVRGTIPINSGTASSSALVVAWTSLLLAVATGEAPDPVVVARLAHQSEVLEFDEPGGMMDHYTSAVGGLLHIDCGEPITVEPLPAQLEGFVLADSGVRKPTTSTLLHTRVTVRAAVETLQARHPEFNLRTTAWEEVAPLVEELPEAQRRPLRGQFVNRDLCREARRMLGSGRVDPLRLGAMLLEHQRQLREAVEVSHPKLDELVAAAVAADALGGKLNGSGGGGAMFAYAPGREREVAAALERAGGRSFLVSPHPGLQVEMD